VTSSSSPAGTHPAGSRRHAAGVRASSLSARRLKSWAGSHGAHGLTVRQGEDGDLGAIQYSSTTTRRRPCMRQRGLAVSGDHHALARSQAVVLDHVGGPKASSASATWSKSSQILAIAVAHRRRP